MLKATGDFRTVKFVSYEAKPMTNHHNGQPYVKKTALVLGASTRDYLSTVYDENGNPVYEVVDGVQRIKKEYKSDFVLMKFNGADADRVKQYCDIKKDNKIVSRHLMVAGSWETYEKDRSVHVDIDRPIEFNGQQLQFKYNDIVVVTETRHILNVDSFRFLDKRPDDASQPTRHEADFSLTPVYTTPHMQQPAVGQGHVPYVQPTHPTPPATGYTLDGTPQPVYPAPQTTSSTPTQQPVVTQAPAAPPPGTLSLEPTATGAPQPTGTFRPPAATTTTPEF